ncbi:ABC transporter substrate-binding protein [Shinella sp.]|uniref:ABC transporter substrate-binding protein n=1 Tax=Shinella sp. TaxID=1870904 RepID=UPI003F72AF2D
MAPGSALSRRALLGALAFVGLGAPARAAGPERMVALDWPSAQNLLGLGVTPLALPERALYAALVVEPALSPATLDLGLRSEPNLELVLQLAPDLVLMGDDLTSLRERIEAASPVVMFSADGFDGTDPVVKGDAALQGLAQRLGRVDAYRLFRQGFDRELDEARKRLRHYDGRPVFVATVIDGRRLLLFGKNSLFQSVLDRFGIVNAWTGLTSAYGHTTVTADRLAQQKDARLLCVGDSSTLALEKLLASPVVASLPFIRSGRVARIPDVLFYGGLPSASRFARLASMALAAEG